MPYVVAHRVNDWRVYKLRGSRYELVAARLASREEAFAIASVVTRGVATFDGRPDDVKKFRAVERRWPRPVFTNS